MAQLKDTKIEGILEIQGKDENGKSLILPEGSKIYVGNSEFTGGGGSGESTLTPEQIEAMGFIKQDTLNGYVTNNKIGGNELGLVKNGGNVVINPNGTMTAPEGTGGGSGDANVQSDWNESEEASDAFIKNKPPIEKGEGQNSIQEESCTAIGDNSVAFGKNNVAGCKGYYIKSIDTTNKKIYLCEEKVTPVISTVDNTNPSFDTPAYEAGDLFNIINDYHYMLCASIASIANSVSNNVISYEGNLGFTEIAEDLGKDGYTFSIPSKPSIGVVNITYGCFVDGENNSAIGTSSLVSGRNNMAVGYYSHVEGRDNITGYSSHAEGYFNKALSIACHAEGGNNEVNGDLSHVEGTGNQANGNVSHAEGKNNIVEGYSSHAEGEENSVKGNISHAEGYDNVINNCNYSHVEGVYNEINSNSNVAHVEGQKNTAIGNIVHAEGGNNIAKGNISHVEGNNNQANGDLSHVEGTGNIADGPASHVEGKGNIATKYYSHAEGYKTEATGEGSHAEGRETKASNYYSHAEGYKTEASGEDSHAEGYETKASNYYSHAEGYKTEASGEGSHAEGFATVASKRYSHAEGFETKAIKAYSHAEGHGTTASGEISHAEGSGTTANGENSHAEGCLTTAIGENSHAEGYGTTASEKNSHAEGEGTTAGGEHSHAEGRLTTASGYSSHAEGVLTKASGDYSHAEGEGTIASGVSSHVQGKNNINDVDKNGKPLNTYAHIVGGGTIETSSNLHTIRWDNGQGFFRGGTTSTGADYAEFFEWIDGNLNNEDRVGLLVTLDGEKIKLANNGDEILGIISGTAAVLGDNYECEWNGKYLTDDFGRVIYDLVEEFVDVEHTEFKEVEKEIVNEETNEIRIEVELEEVKTTEKKSTGFWKHPRLNPDYNPEQKYINRSDRPEWDTVGMLGKLYVRDDGTCIPNFYATVSENGIATSSLEKTNMRVLSRVNDNVVRVLLK